MTPASDMCGVRRLGRCESVLLSIPLGWIGVQLSTRFQSATLSIGAFRPLWRTMVLVLFMKASPKQIVLK